MNVTGKIKGLVYWDIWINRHSRVGFLKDNNRLFDQMREAGLNTAGIAGLLDVKYGGVDAGRELIKSARRKGILLCPFIGVYSYGGVWCRGNHEYNLETYLKKHPERAAKHTPKMGISIHPLHTKLVYACPSQEENRQWMLDGVRWFMKTLKPDGIYLEAGDYGACGCDKCAAQEKSWYTVAASIKMQMPLWEEMHRNNPDVTVIWGCYCGYDRLTSEDIKWINRIPDYVYTMWKVTPDCYYTKIETGKRPRKGKHLGVVSLRGSTHFRLPYNPMYPDYTPHLLQPQINRVKLLAEACRKEHWLGVVIPASGLADRADNEINYRLVGRLLESSDLDGTVREEIDSMFGKGLSEKLVPVLLEIEKMSKKILQYYFWFRSFYNVPDTEMGYAFSRTLPVDLTGGKKSDHERYAPGESRNPGESLAKTLADWKDLSARIQDVSAKLKELKPVASAKGKKKIDQIIEWADEQILLTTYVYPKFLEIQEHRELSDKYLKDLEEKIATDPSFRVLKTITMRVKV